MSAVQRSPLLQPKVLCWLSLPLTLGLLLKGVSFWLAESLWFQEVGYLNLFNNRLLTQILLWGIVFAASLGFLLSNLAIAHHQSKANLIHQDSFAFRSTRLGGLLVATIGLSVLIVGLLLYHGQIAAHYWHPNFSLSSIPQTVPTAVQLETLWQSALLFTQTQFVVWKVGALGGLAIALLLYPQLILSAIALVSSLGFALIVSEHWATVLAALYQTPFNQVDPVFQHEISFFVFSLPVWELLEFWLIGLFALTFCSVTLLYLLAGNSLSQGEFLGLSIGQQRHLLAIGGGWMVTIALGHWLDRYELLYSNRGVLYGASYTNIFVDLPADTALAIAALILGAMTLWLGLFRKPFHKPLVKPGSYENRTQIYRTQSNKSPVLQRQKTRFSARWRGWVYGIWGYICLWAIATVLLPTAVQRLIVQPNELNLERPYILRVLAATRQAFNLETIDVATFNPQYVLNTAALQRNNSTINNIRLWDSRPILESNRQLQRIRPYYEFPDADIDRYPLPINNGDETNRNETTPQQVLIAARELDYSAVPLEAQTWVNQHLVYTHGYGFTLSPVNVAAKSGLPAYFIQGIEQTTTDERIRKAIPTANPQIYYGEITHDYVMTATGVPELDYPSGSENVYNTYDGQGGVAIGAGWRRLLYANHLQDWRIMLAENLTPQTRLLYRRQIKERVEAIAPFLQYDNDPYLVVADIGKSSLDHRSLGPGISEASHYLYWIMDAYTTSDRYPYADPGGNGFNYIRNSVKVVIDAYHGSVSFYVTDPTDPLIRTWSRAFPEVFQPLAQLPISLRDHIRYPEDLYQIQSDQLMVYHMTDPQVFYNREDQWRAPNEIYADKPQIVEPYYLIMKLPTGNSEEFILFRPYTPEQRTNLVAWLAARSDEENYGKLLLYRFPKQELVYGPEQLEARINQDPVISQQISLWNRQGSRALQGNLLVIPIERSLLYVEPLYLEAEHNQLPILARVIVAYGDRIAMAETLDEALNAVFQTDTTDTLPIIRSLDEAPAVP